MGKFSFGRVSSEELDKINPILKTIALKAIDKSTVDFGIIKQGGIRTAEEQHKLFLEGRSTIDGLVKPTTHQTGMAMDLIPYINGNYTWDNHEAFHTINKCVLDAWKEMNNKEFKLIWGGDWKTFLDMPHYELRKL
jgi:peptidoglycan L-alanyl-D-glutamate endopeptidase CwlK